MNIVVSLAPIGRGTLRKSVDTLCYYQKCYLRTLSYHLPALITPFIRLIKKEVGGETGINDIAVRVRFGRFDVVFDSCNRLFFTTAVLSISYCASRL